jgi:predicted nucleotidyltransferase
MKSLVTKTVGIHDVLLAALHPLKDKINLAFIYGSTACLKENTQSDVDVMIVGRVHFPDVIEHLARPVLPGKGDATCKYLLGLL